MMGREKRAQSLLPSFVLVAGAAAVGCDGSAKWSVNPPFPIWGGSGNVGSPGQAGFGANPPTEACPVSAPVSGSVCLSPSEGGPSQCDYGTRTRCAAMLAWCVDGVWEVTGNALGCAGSGGVGGTSGSAGEAPIAEAGADAGGTSGSAGEAPIAEAGADAGGTSGSAGEAPTAEAGAGGEGPGPVPVVECPQAVPPSGGYCYKPSTLTSYRCDYLLSCGSYEATCTGQWQVAFHEPTDVCAAGASGN
ncbi:MAG TPA: hypothetical protein VGC79_24510 [Polyangiaceae bacterium]